jgi:hypothetical protein
MKIDRRFAPQDTINWPDCEINTFYVLSHVNGNIYKPSSCNLGNKRKIAQYLRSATVGWEGGEVIERFLLNQGKIVGIYYSTLK